jgi:hypothetical protein
MTGLSPAELGAELLDRALPGWRERIAVAELDLQDCGYCILGQLWGDFEDGMGVLFGSDWDLGDACQYGFDAGRPEEPYLTWSGLDWDLYYLALNEQWRDLVRRER